MVRAGDQSRVLPNDDLVMEEITTQKAQKIPTCLCAYISMLAKELQGLTRLGPYGIEQKAKIPSR